MVLGDLTNNLLQKFFNELRKDKHQQRFQYHVLNPMGAYIEGILKPYFFTLLIVLLVMIGLLLWLLRLILRLVPSGGDI